MHTGTAFMHPNITRCVIPAGDLRQRVCLTAKCSVCSCMKTDLELLWPQKGLCCPFIACFSLVFISALLCLEWTSLCAQTPG